MTRNAARRGRDIVASVTLVTTVALAAPAGAPAATKRAQASRLQPFDSCVALVRYAERNARRTGGSTGVPTRAPRVSPLVVESPPLPGEVVALQAPAAAPGGRGGAEAAPEFSQTNVQELGVDEPDVVKTDGRRLFAVTDATLHAFSLDGGTPRLAGSLRLEGSSHQLLLRGNRLLVMASTFGAVSEGRPPAIPNPTPQARPSTSIAPSSQSALLTEIDVTESGAMVVRRSMTLDGRFVDARQTGGTARVVVASSPQVPPEPRLARSRPATWVPRTVLRSQVSGRTFRRGVVGCDDVRRPPAFSGLDLLSVLTIDLDKGLFSVDRDAIMAGADTVYASPGSLYVASRRYVAALEAGRSIPEEVRTQVHRFDASRPDVTRYRSSGSVQGFVLNQYAMSEHDGVLRVASTSEPQWFGDGSSTETESFVSTLRERDRSLQTLGRAGGLGRGERIFAVRFVGEKGYVVTFRQVDPLYTLDLSRPSEPRVLGELKIAGYSAYLHPVSDDLLLGVGQDATTEGRTLGTQLSLFDVGDLRRPRRVAQADLGRGASSEAEFDPHAFLFWRPTSLTLLPLRVGGGATPFSGVVGYHVGRGELGERGLISHPANGDRPAPPISRSVVVGDRILTLSHAGLGTSRLDTLAPVAFAPLPPA